MTYSTVSSCDGQDSAIIAATECVIPVADLKAAPFELAWGGSVHAKLYATNVEGDSLTSLLGNGAIIIRDPDTPTNLIEDYSLRTETQLGLQWTEEYDGGATIIEYRISISYDLGANFETLATSTSTAFTVVSLTPG